MKTLLVMRHAKSSWNDSRLADHQRPLNGRGRLDAPQMGRFLLREELTPDLIISSTAVRARTTAVAVADACDYAGQVETTADFYDAGPEAYMDRLAQLADPMGRVMVVGHNPGVSDLVAELTRQFIAMPTAAVAYIELPVESWSDIYELSWGRLKDVWRPREI